MGTVAVNIPLEAGQIPQNALNAAETQQNITNAQQENALRLQKAPIQLAQAQQGLQSGQLGIQNSQLDIQQKQRALAAQQELAKFFRGASEQTTPAAPIAPSAAPPVQYGQGSSDDVMGAAPDAATGPTATSAATPTAKSASAPKTSTASPQSAYGPTMKQAAYHMIASGFPEIGQQMLQHAIAIDKAAADADESKRKVIKDQNDAAGGILTGILSAPPELKQQAYEQGIQQMQAQGIPLPPNLPAQYPGDDILRIQLGSVATLDQAFKQREVVAAETSANARKTNADSAALDRQRSEAAVKLSNAKDQADYDQMRGEMQAKIATFFPAKFDRTAVLQAGAKPEEILASEKAPKPGENEWIATVNDPNAAPAEKAAAQANLDKLIQVHKAQQRPISITNAVTPGPGGAPSAAAQMAADGRMAPATLRAMLRRDPNFMNQVVQADPNFSEDKIQERYDTLKEFTNTSNTKAGGQVLALNALIHHADLYLATADALKNGQFRPGNAAYNAVANAFGSAPPTQANLVARFLAGETGKVATGGIPAEGEINGILKNMGNDAGPDQIKGAAQSLLGIAAGRMIPLQEKVNHADLQARVQVLGPDAQAILTRHGFDPATMKPIAKGGGGGAIPAAVSTLLSAPSVKPGIHKLSDGSSWMKGADGTITRQ